MVLTMLNRFKGSSLGWTATFRGGDSPGDMLRLLRHASSCRWHPEIPGQATWLPGLTNRSMSGKDFKEPRMKRDSATEWIYEQSLPGSAILADCFSNGKSQHASNSDILNMF